MKSQIEEAIKILNQGGIIIFPTDTAFAIGCRIDDEKAVRKLFRIRNRPSTKAVPVLIDGIDMAKKYLKPIPQEVKNILMDTYWPGALTIILPCLKEKVSDLVRGGSENLGVRMPNHHAALEIIKKVGVPVLGTSANIHGGRTPYDLKDLDQNLIRSVDFIVEGECNLKQESTVIDCSVKPWKILRSGAVKLPIY